MRDLEYLSEEVRKGHPIGFLEALAVIEYQSNIRKNKLSIWQRFVKRFKGNRR